MPQLKITEGAAVGLERCRQFLLDNNPAASIHAAKSIQDALSLLEQQPSMGAPVDDLPTLRELTIPFGKDGYVCLYRFEQDQDTVYLLAFRHQKEAGY